MHIQLPFEHKQSAHCENGVTSNLLRFSGLNSISEPLAFGMGSGLFYIHIPFLKINNGPAISFRTMPGMIFKRTCKSLGIKVIRKKFSSESEAMQFLDRCLADGQPAGCQVGVYYLSYFPKEYRFHFNAHNLVVYGMTDDHYLISDPVMEQPTLLTFNELRKVRFARGPLAPHGQIYYPVINQPVDAALIARAIKKGIRRNVRDMLRIPGPIAGVSGIRYTSGKIRKWRDQLGLKTAGAYLAQLVRMQEEIGTGGGGFRFIYAAFLQEAYAYVPDEKLPEISALFTRSGDIWRNAAVQAAGIFKGRLTAQSDFDAMADLLLEAAEVEKKAFTGLSNLKG